MKLLALSIFLVVIGSALADRWVNIYRNNKQPCNSPINIDLPTDQNYYQYQILVENNALTKDLDFYLWSDCEPGNAPYYDSTKCLLFPSKCLTWNEARSYCSNVYGGYLKDDLNVKESSYLKSQTGTNEYWIGLSDFETPGTFAWDRGLNKPMEPLNPGGYNLWSNGQQPEYNANKTCVTEIAGQTWYQDDCNQKKLFVCQKASQQLPVGRYAFSASNCQSEYYNVKIQISPDTKFS